MSDLKRPMPSAALLELEGTITGPAFIPAPDLLAWTRATFIDEGATLENPDHAHLGQAIIGMLWTNAPNSRRGKMIVGQAEFKPPAIIGKWPRARAQQQLQDWFGPEELDFLITIDAGYAATCSDGQFCALIEHELYHCAQDRDEFGQPKFKKESGLPVFTMRGHDIEQFIGVVQRYGADAAGVRELVEAANSAPHVRDDDLAIACGTCAH